MINALQTWTGVGTSAPLPHHIREVANSIGYQAARHGCQLRSGGAHGSDTEFYHGVENFIHNHQLGFNFASTLAKIYLPREAHNGWVNTDGFIHFIDAPALSNFSTARAIASEIHPVWDQLSPFVKKLHARNVYQVLGQNLDDPSDVFIMYAQWEDSTKTSVKGGTNTAFQLAREYRIPVYNLVDPDHFEELKAWAEE